MWQKLFFKHKPGQGMVVRGSGLAILAALYLFGCYGLYFTLRSWGEFFQKPLGGLEIPLVRQPLNPGFLITIGLFAGLVIMTARILDRPKTADLLIDTEAEINKVTWPSWPETVNASVVVIFTTVLMAILLFVFDFVLRLATGLVL